MNQSFAFHLHEHVIKADVDESILTLSISLPGAVCQHTDIVFFAKSLDVLLDLGYEIVNAVRKLQTKDGDNKFRGSAVNELNEPITAEEAKATMSLIADACDRYEPGACECGLQINFAAPEAHRIGCPHRP